MNSTKPPSKTNELRVSADLNDRTELELEPDQSAEEDLGFENE